MNASMLRIKSKRRKGRIMTTKSMPSFFKKSSSKNSWKISPTRRVMGRTTLLSKI